MLRTVRLSPPQVATTTLASTMIVMCGDEISCRTPLTDG